MKKSRLISIIRESVRNILLEGIYGNIATVYHGSTTPPEQMFKFFEEGYKPGHGSGAWFGIGFYAMYNDEDLEGSRTGNGSYGRYIYKVRINLDGFVFFVKEQCIKVLGKHMTLREQLQRLKLPHVLKRIESNEKHAEFLDMELPSEEVKTGDGVSGETIATNIHSYIANEVTGIVFSGGADGKVVVVYATKNNVLLLSWTKAPFSNKEPGWFKKIIDKITGRTLWTSPSSKENKEARKRFATKENIPGEFARDNYPGGKESYQDTKERELIDYLQINVGEKINKGLEDHLNSGKTFLEYIKDIIENKKYVKQRAFKKLALRKALIAALERASKEDLMATIEYINKTVPTLKRFNNFTDLLSEKIPDLMMSLDNRLSYGKNFEEDIKEEIELIHRFFIFADNINTKENDKKAVIYNTFYYLKDMYDPGWYLYYALMLAAEMYGKEEYIKLMARKVAVEIEESFRIKNKTSVDPLIEFMERVNDVIKDFREDTQSNIRNQVGKMKVLDFASGVLWSNIDNDKVKSTAKRAAKMFKDHGFIDQENYNEVLEDLSKFYSDKL